MHVHCAGTHDAEGFLFQRVAYHARQLVSFTRRRDLLAIKDRESCKTQFLFTLDENIPLKRNSWNYSSNFPWNPLRDPSDAAKRIHLENSRYFQTALFFIAQPKPTQSSSSVRLRQRKKGIKEKWTVSI